MAQEGNPLSRWSRLKHEQRRLEQEKLEQQRLERRLPLETAGAPVRADDALPPLPPVESLTPQSDFTGFMHPKVQDSVRRVALKKLFADPHFSIPDLNEAYSGDWTGGEPITQEMLKQLNQAYTLLFSDDEKKALDEERARLAAAEEAKQETKEEPKEDPQHHEPGRQDT